MPQLRVEWSTDLSAAKRYARFFKGAVGTEYISHGEIQQGYALDSRHWSPRVLDLWEKEFADVMSKTAGDELQRKLAISYLDDELAGIARVDFDRSGCFATLQDIAISPRLRRSGVGKAMMAWIEARAREAGMIRIFLESGLGNEAAHEFFEKFGFTQCSIVMTKDI